MVAVKLIPKRHRFARAVYEHETDILRRLSHPNILPLVDAYETPDDFVIATKFLKGGDMFKRLQELHHYTEATAAHIAKKMLQALHYCHKHNVVHRDLKHGNYVYDDFEDESELILIDFGEALHIGDDEEHDDCVGTPFYMAPEIVDNDFTLPRTGKVLKAADVWALGVILFMMLAGRPPFMGMTDDDIFDAILDGEYKWPAEPRVSDAAKALVARMLIPDHTKRITAAEALQHPWIVSDAQRSTGDSLGAAVRALADFSATARAKNAIAGLLLKQMTDEDTAKLRRLFDELDTDGDRLLDAAELAEYMLHHGYADKAAAEKAAHAFLKVADESKRGSINFLEFEYAHTRGQLGHDAIALRKAFDALDTEGSGVIDMRSVRALLGDETADTIAELVANVSKTERDRVSFATFFTALTAENARFAALRSPSRMRNLSVSSTRNLHSHSSSTGGGSGIGGGSRLTTTSAEAIVVDTASGGASPARPRLPSSPSGRVRRLTSFASSTGGRVAMLSCDAIGDRLPGAVNESASPKSPASPNSTASITALVAFASIPVALRSSRSRASLLGGRSPSSVAAGGGSQASTSPTSASSVHAAGGGGLAYSAEAAAAAAVASIELEDIGEPVEHAY